MIVDNNLDYETNYWLIGIGVDGNQVGANDPTRQCCDTHLAIVLSSKYYKARFLVVQISPVVTYCNLVQSFNLFRIDRIAAT